jgi:hypothetical protein
LGEQVGFEFVNMDAGVWAPERSATGEIVPDPSKFPSGMAALSAKIHGKGLKMGLYTDLSNRTVGMVCGTGPGSFGHYESDTKVFAAAGADFLKVDCAYGSGCTFAHASHCQSSCSTEPLPRASDCAYDQTTTSKYHPSIPEQLGSWQQLRDALNATGRPIYSYFCPRSFGGSVVPPDKTRGDCGPPPKRCIDDGPPHQWDGPTRKVRMSLCCRCKLVVVALRV